MHFEQVFADLEKPQLGGEPAGKVGREEENREPGSVFRSLWILPPAFAVLAASEVLVCFLPAPACVLRYFVCLFGPTISLMNAAVEESSEEEEEEENEKEELVVGLGSFSSPSGFLPFCRGLVSARVVVLVAAVEVRR